MTYAYPNDRLLLQKGVTEVQKNNKIIKIKCNSNYVRNNNMWGKQNMHKRIFIRCANQKKEYDRQKNTTGIKNDEEWKWI